MEDLKTLSGACVVYGVFTFVSIAGELFAFLNFTEFRDAERKVEFGKACVEICVC